VANNWDVVCLAPEHPKGLNDYSRFVRKHAHYFAPTEDGAIECGVSHVDPVLSPFGPPARELLPEINTRQLGRSTEREPAHQRWHIGQPYANQELAALTVRWKRHPGVVRRTEISGAVGEPSSIRQIIVRSG